MQCTYLSKLTFLGAHFQIQSGVLKYQSEWSHQITADNEISAQILLGSDQAILHPVDAIDPLGLPIESEHARLKSQF